MVKEQLKKIFEENTDQRIVVVGATCTGKSTLLKDFDFARDMDEIVFPLMTEEEKDYVCQTPWTPEVGKKMNQLTRERVIVSPGKPVFGTVVLDSDLIVYLHISDELLRERTGSRKANFQDAKDMQAYIETEINTSDTPVVKVIIK